MKVTCLKFILVPQMCLKKWLKRKVSRKNGLAAETIGLQVSYFS